MAGRSTSGIQRRPLHGRQRHYRNGQGSKGSRQRLIESIEIECETPAMIHRRVFSLRTPLLRFLFATARQATNLISTMGRMAEPIILTGTDADLPRELPHGLKRYTGFREMARGATAMLQSCFDTVTGRTIALKSLQPDSRFDNKERRRLLREARVTAQLQHPNTVPVYDIGNDEQEGIYFTMKRISGENFFEILKRIARGDQVTRRSFPNRRRLEILADSCQALAYAHARGVIHRDVKPENIWVGNFGEVILLDWGVAKVWGHTDDNEPIKHSLDRPIDEHSQLQTLTGGGQRPGYSAVHVSGTSQRKSWNRTNDPTSSARAFVCTKCWLCANHSAARTLTRRLTTSKTKMSHHPVSVRLIGTFPNQRMRW